MPMFVSFQFLSGHFLLYLQPGSSISSGIPGRTIHHAAVRSAEVSQDPSLVNIKSQINRPSKLLKLEDGRGSSLPNGGSDNTMPVLKPEGQYPEKQTPQVLLYWYFC